MSDKWEKSESSFNETFKFEKEKDEIVGILKEVKRNIGPNNSNKYVLVAKGEEVEIWGSTQLDAHLDKTDRLGKEVKIVFKGIVTSEKSGREFKDYDIFFRDVAKEKDVVDF